MRVAFFSSRSYDREFFTAANEEHGHELTFFDPRLTLSTSALATGYPAICVFVNDKLDKVVIENLAKSGLRLIALRSAGYNHVDLEAADHARVHVSRVPSYSPQSVAEHTIALMLTLNRKVHRAYARVREGNFALEGLMGREMRGQTVGIVGTGRIGARVAQILKGFDCRILAYDFVTNIRCQALGVQYVSMQELLEQSDVVTLHCPLTPATHHLIDTEAIASMKSGVALINTSRGALIDTRAVIEGLKAGKVGYLAIDTYEEEQDIFFDNLSDKMIHDDVFARLLTFPNVLVTGHQGFFTREALDIIARTTLSNITAFERGDMCKNTLTAWGRMTCEEERFATAG